jgi:hypothetical protein
VSCDGLGRIASERLACHPFDVVIALSGATELAFLQTDTPTVLIEDANFALLHNYHAHFSSLLESSAYQLHTLQAKGISKADWDTWGQVTSQALAEMLCQQKHLELLMQS